MTAVQILRDYTLAYQAKQEAGFKDLDKKYAKSFKSLTQDQRKKALHFLNPSKYSNPGDVSGNLKTTRGKGLLKKASRSIQNLRGKRISSKMVQDALHEWAKNAKVEKK